MANNRPLVIGAAIAAVAVAIIAMILLLNPSQGASISSPTPDDNSLRTQIYEEMTSTAIVLAVTGQAETVVALQSTIDAQAQASAATPEQVQINPTAIPQVVEQVATQASVVLVVTATSAPQVAVNTPTPQPRPTTAQAEEWSVEQFNVRSGTVTLGDNTGWVVFQGWDGQSVETTVHGVIEPQKQVVIPAPFEGTYWIVTGISYEGVTERALEMRDEALQQGTAGTAPPLLYIGEDHVPEGYSIRLPRGWQVR